MLLTALQLHALAPAKNFFSRYAVPLTPTTAAPAPVLDTRDKRLFRTRIRQGVVQGPVFADHYAVAKWGCGTSCLQFAIVDVRTGSVYLFPYSVSMDFEHGELLTYHRNSRVMHIIGGLNEKDPADRWFVWNGHELSQVSSRPIKLVPDDAQ